MCDSVFTLSSLSFSVCVCDSVCVCTYVRDSVVTQDKGNNTYTMGGERGSFLEEEAEVVAGTTETTRRRLELGSASLSAARSRSLSFSLRSSDLYKSEFIER